MGDVIFCWFVLIGRFFNKNLMASSKENQVIVARTASDKEAQRQSPEEYLERWTCTLMTF